MSGSNTQSMIDYLTFIMRELNRYIPLTFLILGTIGNILNILVFTRPSLRTNSCSVYFISSSVINFVSLYIGLVTPFLGVYNLDPSQTNNSLCKARFYLRYSTITLSTWYILLACFDRYSSTSSHVYIRSWSSIRLAKRIVCVAGIMCFTLPYTQVFYCYGVNQKNVCTQQNTICKLLNDIILLFCNSGLPPVLMVIISMLTIRNVQRSTRTANGQRRDIQLVRILFIQVFILVLFAIPVAIQKLYTSSTAFLVKDSLATAVDNLINQISIEISYISNSTIFYIYSLTSKKFRKEVFQILSSCYRICQTNAVQPAELTRGNLSDPTAKSRTNFNIPVIQNANIEL